MNMVRCEDLKKHFSGTAGTVKALDGVSLEIGKGSFFGLVGESGCGKTTLGKIILGIIRPDSGRLFLETKKVQVVFQDPYNSLDPKMKIFDILAEGLIIQRSFEKPSFPRKRESKVWMPASAGMTETQNTKYEIEKVLGMVNLPNSALKKYPHQFSGGERQRIAIARAVITRPEFIVLDEPVSSLDVTIQLQVLNLLKDIQKRLDITCLFISHDLKVIKFICDKVAVMLRGRIVETGRAGDIYSSPAHPYTKALLKAAFYDNMKKYG
ncbi:MAG: ATP-binding cassette domain-containing protein [Candidatus Omnitrophota bacterium]